MAISPSVAPPLALRDTAALSGDARWQLAQRIAASEPFSRSELLQRFLLHICELYLLDRTEQIKEQQIGVRVFGRPASYNPGDDNIVRNYAVQLRKRLALYFEGQGRSEPFRIEIPRGGYLPVFQSCGKGEENLPLTGASPERKNLQLAELLPGAASQTAPRRADWRMFFVGLGIGTLLLGTVILPWTMHHALPARQAAPAHPLWSAIFPANRDTFIVPADSGLGILENLTEDPANLTSYLNGEYLTNVKLKGVDEGNLNDLRTQRYTSMADLNITSRLSHLPEVVPDHLIIKYARDLRMDDLKNGNAILLGAIHTDPWVSLLQNGLNFQFACGRRVNDCYIVNSHPARGESALYRSDPDSPTRETYSIVALLPNLDHTGWILLIEGLNMAGTEAAADMLLDDTTMGPVIRQTISPDGSLKPFELLVRTGSLGAEALPAAVVARRLAE